MVFLFIYFFILNFLTIFLKKQVFESTYKKLDYVKKKKKIIGKVVFREKYIFSALGLHLISLS